MNASTPAQEQTQETGWDTRSFAALLGLDDRSGQKSHPANAYLAKADHDPATGGIVHLDTHAQYDKRSGAPLNIDMRFSTLKLNGNLTRQHVFQIKTRLSADKKLVIPERVTFMGRSIYNEENDQGDFNGQALNNVFQAIGELNRMMRPPFSGDMETHSPKMVLKVLKDNHLDDIIGEGIDKLFEGITAEGTFDFTYAPRFNEAANDNIIILPDRDFARAVIGDRRVNSLDPQESTVQLRPIAATHKQSGTQFIAQSDRRITKTKLKQSAALNPSGPVIAGVDRVNIPSLFQMEFTSANHNDADAQVPQKLSSLSFLGKSLKEETKLTLARVLRVMHRLNQDMQDGIYPRTLRHLVEADISELASDTTPPEKGESRFEIMRHMGTSFEKKLAGVGDQLGDGTEIMHVETDKDGNIHKWGAMFDCGAALPPKGSEYSLIAPDITKSLAHFSDLFITHHHLDHKDGIGPYVDAEMFASPEFYARMKDGDMVGKTVHATEKVILRLEKMLEKNSVPKELWPKRNPLKGSGWVHIRNPHTNKLIMSVQYSAESSPHSARTTPYRIIMREGNQFKSSLLKPGDFRFGSHLVKGHDGPLPVGKLIDEEFFNAGPEAIIAEEQRRLTEIEECMEALNNQINRGTLYGMDLERVRGEIKQLQAEIERHKSEMIAPEAVAGRRDILEVDCTNDKQPGFAPTELEVEKNEIIVKSWFPEMMSIDPMISTADARIETKLRVAVQTDCHISFGGANLKDAGIITNKLGVNKDLDDPEIQQKFIQAYMDDIYISHHNVHTRLDLDAYLEDYLERPPYGKVKGEIYEQGRDDFIAWLANCVIDPKEAFTKTDFRAICFHILKHSTQSNVRYGRQKEMERIFKSVMQDNEIEDEIRLGSIFVGYEAKTWRQMVKDDKSRTKMPITGTQGVEAEQEAWWPKWVDGRAVFNANPKNRKTAIPLKKGDAFILRGQTTIPGNEGDFHDFLAESNEKLGVPTIVASGRGFKIYNLDTLERRRTIEKSLKDLGKAYDLDAEGTITVHDMPVHATGHGYQKDNDRLIDLVDPEFIVPAHCDDRQTIVEFLQRMDERGLKNAGQMIDTFTKYTYESGEKHGDITCKTIGRVPASMLLVQQKKEFLKQWGGYSVVQRATAIDGLGGTLFDALTAGESFNPADESNIILQHFSGLDRAQEDADSKKRPYYQRRSRFDIQLDQEYKRYEGPMMPKRGAPTPGVDEDDLFQQLGIE